MNKGKVVLGALAGLATGAIAGILLAPEKGSVSRKQIIDQGNDFVGKLKQKINYASEPIRDTFIATKNDAEGWVNKGQEKIDEAAKGVRNIGSSSNHNNPL